MINFFFIFFFTIINLLLLIVPILILVAFFTLLERKVIASMQLREGPNKVGPIGLLQPIIDGVKLFIKETIIPIKINIYLFLISPILTLFLSLISWFVIPFDYGVVFIDLNIGLLYILAISSLGVYGIIASGWSSNSKYALLGSLRATAQMISYEVSIGLILISVLLCSNSLNFTQIVLSQETIWYIIPLWPCWLLFVISAFAETNRPPFDLPEAEAELVAGYNIEYSAMGFAMFFLGEYSNMLLMSSLSTILFLGGWLFFINLIPNILVFFFKTFIMIYLFIWVRASFPRYRYDQLMRLGWKVFLPISLVYVVLVAIILRIFFFF